MAKYQPTPQEQAAIDLLTLSGHTVVRQRTYDALRERIRIAEVTAEMERDRRASNERWAHRCLDEERRLTARLNELCTAAAALGLSITDINAALHAADTKDS